MINAQAIDKIRDRANDLIDELERCRAEIQAEKKANPENTGLQHLLKLQENRINWLLQYLDREAEETIRDMTDRMHVINEARAHRFN